MLVCSQGGRSCSDSSVPGAAGAYPRWLSIKFRGGANFYPYVDGNPTSKVDPLGLSGWYFETRTCVLSIMQETRIAHCSPGKNAADDYSCRVAHCVANCKITRECLGGRVQAILASYTKEAWDEFKTWTYAPNGEGYSSGDQRANSCGRDFGRRFPERSCQALCKDVR